MHINIFRNHDIQSAELTSTSCLTNLYYYSHVNPNLQLNIPIMSFSHSLGYALGPTVRHPSSLACWLNCNYFFSGLRIPPSAIPSEGGVLYLKVLHSVQSRLPVDLSTASFHGSAFNPCTPAVT
jgi:hypothetical protein